jgi:hypothetical protein
MLNKTKVILSLAMLVASTSAGLGYVHHDVPRPESVHARAAVDPANPFREVQPGFWVGPYQCVTNLERGGRDCSSS